MDQSLICNFTMLTFPRFGVVHYHQFSQKAVYIRRLIHLGPFLRLYVKTAPLKYSFSSIENTISPLKLRYLNLDFIETVKDVPKKHIENIRHVLIFILDAFNPCANRGFLQFSSYKNWNVPKFGNRAFRG